MNSTRPVKRAKRWLPAGLLLVVLAVGLLGLVAAMAGVRAVDFNHCLVRVRFDGVDSAAAEEQVRAALPGLQGYRRSRFARVHAAANFSERAEIEFAAGSITEATLQLAAWQRQFREPLQASIEKLDYQPVSVYRPGRGNIVLGVRQSLSGSELNAAGAAKPEPGRANERPPG